MERRLKVLERNFFLLSFCKKNGKGNQKPIEDLEFHPVWRSMLFESCIGDAFHQGNNNRVDQFR